MELTKRKRFIPDSTPTTPPPKAIVRRRIKPEAERELKYDPLPTADLKWLKEPTAEAVERFDSLIKQHGPTQQTLFLLAAHQHVAYATELINKVSQAGWQPRTITPIINPTKRSK